MKLAIYKGESRKWNFEKYVRVHMDQHQILTDLKDHGYAGIDERSKVRHLQDGIKTSALDSVINTILASATLRTDFTACVALYQDFILQSTSSEANRTLLVTSVDTSGRGGRGGKRR